MIIDETALNGWIQKMKQGIKESGLVTYFILAELAWIAKTILLNACQEVIMSHLAWSSLLLCIVAGWNSILSIFVLWLFVFLYPA